MLLPDFWILGINARNLKYIKKFNPKKAIRLADNKLKTKNFLSQRWIPVPQTYGIIKNRRELFNFDWNALPDEEFVIKPNKWSKGKGIMIVKKLDSLEDNKESWKDFLIWRYLKSIWKFWKGWENNLEHSQESLRFKVGKDILTYNDFVRRLIDVLDWKFSLTFWWDKILIEEKLEPWESFKIFCKYWLADIRVIVFNLIPVAAMVRMPMPWSWWKANLAQWWVGLWIEVGSWKIKSMYYKRKIFTNNFPWEFSHFWRKKIQFWDDILLFSSKIQYFVNIWYLALDWVITEDGPKLLEINARAGLEVQNASNLPLKHRLEKISDIKVDDPSKWVEIAKSLFTSEKKKITLSKVIYLSQKANLILEGEDEDKKIEVVVEVDLKKTKNYATKDILDLVNKHKDWDIILDLFESEVRFKNLKFNLLEHWKWKIILWREVLSNYYIKPIKKTYQNIDFINPENIIESEIEDIKYLDEKIRLLSNKLNLNSILKPINYLDELDNFITWWWNYNPKFEYKRPKDKFLEDIKWQILSLKDKYFGNVDNLKSNFSKLFEEKLDELLIRVNLIQAYKKQKYDKILEYNEKLFWKLNDELVNLSKEKIFIEENNDEVLWRILTYEEVKHIIRKYLDERGFENIKIVSDVSSLSRITVTRLSNNAIVKLNPHAVFREKEIYATLAHEIDVHVRRFINWVKTWWNILRMWTGFYLKDEEWLAVWKSFQVLPEGYEKKWMYIKYYLLDQAQKNHFARVAEIYRWIVGWDLMKSFRAVFRLKKWIQNTWFIDKWAIWMKDIVYLDWYIKIKNWVNSWWKIDKLMIWKIKVEDIEKIV